jgi:hypothetical protein
LTLKKNLSIKFEISPQSDKHIFMRFFLVLFLFVSLQANAITIKNGQFIQDGKPMFMLGLSYFDGLSASPRILESDLNFFGERGFNALRVWANWYPDFQPKTTGLLEPDGSVNVQLLNRLQRMIEIADKKGFVIKLTFSRHPLEEIQFQKYKNGILAVVQAIKNSDNVLLDLQNETDHCGTTSDPNCLGHLSLAQVRKLRDAIKEIDPDQIVTASWGGGEAQDYKSFVEQTNVDFVATHGPARKKDWAEKTPLEMKRARSQIDPEIPILFDEPSRCDKGVDCKDPSAAQQFLMAAQNAKSAGAAGWFFHTTAGFRLNNRPMHERLNRTEKIAVNRLADAVK